MDFHIGSYFTFSMVHREGVFLTWGIFLKLEWVLNHTFLPDILLANLERNVCDKLIYSSLYDFWGKHNPHFVSTVCMSTLLYQWQFLVFKDTGNVWQRTIPSLLAPAWTLRNGESTYHQLWDLEDVLEIEQLLLLEMLDQVSLVGIYRYQYQLLPAYW